MANWKSRINFRDLIGMYDESADDEIKEITRIKPFWIERFNSIDSLKHFIPSLKKVKTEAGFNKWLSKVYDYCDDNLIWVDF